MSVGIVRVQKMGGGSVKGIEIHDRREKDGISHTNQDIDWSKSQDNYDLHPAQNESFTRAVKQRIAELDLPRAVRKDAVVLAQVLVTSEHSFFEGMNREQQQQFFKDSYEFLAERYGRENIVSATVHLDERTPHMHFNFVPVTKDGRLSAKSILTRQELIAQQDKFQEKVGQKYGLERGLTKEQRIEQGKQRKNFTVPEYKALMAEMQSRQREVEAMTYEAATKAQELERTQSRIEELEKETKALQEKSAALQEILKAKSHYIAQMNQIPKGKKTLLGKVEFSQAEASALIQTAETVYGTMSDLEVSRKNIERLKDHVVDVEHSAGAQKNLALREQVRDLQQEVVELQRTNGKYLKELKQLDKYLEQNEDVSLDLDAFKAHEQAIEKAEKARNLGQEK